MTPPGLMHLAKEAQHMAKTGGHQARTLEYVSTGAIVLMGTACAMHFAKDLLAVLGGSKAHDRSR